MNGYWNFITVAHCPHDAAHGELGEANLGLVSVQPKSTRRTAGGLGDTGSPGGEAREEWERTFAITGGRVFLRPHVPAAADRRRPRRPGQHQQRRRFLAHGRGWRAASMSVKRQIGGSRAQTADQARSPSVTRTSSVPVSAELGKGVGERGEHGGVVRWREDDDRQV